MDEDIFRSTRLKVERAKHHIDDLNIKSTSFLRKHRHLIIIDNPETGLRGLGIDDNEPIPDSFGLIIGDALHNLRSALDHLIWALVSGYNLPQPKRVQFPFARDANALVKAIDEMKISAAGQPIVDILKRIAPYPGGDDELCSLHELEIIDKHRVIASISTPVFVDPVALHEIDPTAPNVVLQGLTFDIGKGECIATWPYSPMGRQQRRAARIPKNGSQIKATFDILFGRGQPFALKPVISTLVKLQEKVSRILNLS